MRQTLRLINQNCRLAARLISDAGERELSRLERGGLAIHLMGCRSCRRYREQLRMLDELVDTACTTPSPELTEVARERILLNVTRSR